MPDLWLASPPTPDSLICVIVFPTQPAFRNSIHPASSYLYHAAGQEAQVKSN